MGGGDGNRLRLNRGPLRLHLQAIRDHSKIMMGKNTMMRRSIRLYCERTGNDQWLQLLDHMVGNVGLIFTKGDLNEVRRALLKVLCL